MGYAISWIAVKNASPERILDFYGFSPTAETEEFPESELSAAGLPNGWYLLWFNRCESPYVQADVIAALSADCTVVTCVLEEHVMYSRSEYWENGARLWRIVHDAQQGIYDLQTEGALPEGFDRMQAKIFSEQDAAGGDRAEVDYVFDLPLAPLQRLTGFKHDEVSPELEGLEFSVLAGGGQKAAATESRPWWKLW